MSTSVQRPPAEERTPETPAAIARTIAALATAPVRDFVSCISDEDNTREHLYQRLVARLTADWPNAWSQAKEDHVEERLAAALATDEDRELFGQFSDHYGTKLGVGESAAFLLGVEVGRQCGGPEFSGGSRPDPPGNTTADDDLTPEQRAIEERARVDAATVTSFTPADDEPVRVLPRGPFTPEELMEARRPRVEDALTEAIGALRLAEALSSLKAAGDGDYTVPIEAASVLARLTYDAANQLTRLQDALPGHLMVTAVEDVADIPDWDEEPEPAKPGGERPAPPAAS